MKCLIDNSCKDKELCCSFCKKKRCAERCLCKHDKCKYFNDEKYNKEKKNGR